MAEVSNYHENDNLKTVGVHPQPRLSLYPHSYKNPNTGRKNRKKSKKKKKRLFIIKLQPGMMIQKTAVVSEDFTFPQVTSHTSLSSLHLSGGSASSFWYAPSHLSSMHPNMPKECHLQGVEREAHQRRSSSFVEGGTRVFPSTRGLELSCNDCAHSDTASFTEFDMEEEKMDMLWEDFQNYDELTQAGLERKEAEFAEGRFSGPPVYYDMRAEGHKLPGFCCVEALNMSKSSRPGVVVMLKVLKKLFMLHNPHCPKRA